MQQWPGLKTFVTLVMLLALHLSITAQVAYHNFNSNDGLPSNEVYCAYQDQQGFLWFGTDHGVVKYNGYSFKTYTTTDGLTDNTILDIKGDDDNQLWAITLSGGMCYFDGKKFVPHPNNDTIKKLFSKGIPTSYEILHNKEVWLGFVERGVAKIDTNKAVFYAAVNRHLTGDTISHLYNDTVNIYVVRLNNGKFIYTTLLVFKLPAITDSNVKCIEVYHMHFNCMPLNELNANLLCLENKNIILSKGNYMVYIDSLKQAHPYTYPGYNPILKLKQTGDQKIWMFQKNSPGYSILIKNGRINFLDSLSFINSASNVLQDHQGNYWITTLDQGIFMCPSEKIRIYSHPDFPRQAKLSCINSDNNNLYVGLPEGKLLKIDRQFNSSIYNEVGGKSAAAPTSITFKLKSEPETNLDPQFYWHRSANLFRTKILQINERNFLLGTPAGIELLSNEKKVLFMSWVSGFTKRVTEICKISSEKYLIGTLSGLYYYQPNENNKITEDIHFKNTRITSTKVLNTEVYGVATRGDGVYLKIKNKFYRISESQGIISNLAEDLYFENDSVLWEASFKGISKIYFRLLNDSLYTRIKNYTKEDGLCSNQVNGITGFNGYIWLATNEGLCYFKTQDLSESITMIPLYFNSITVNGQRHQADSLFLSHDENNIFIEFNAIYYKAIQGIRYKVRLNGIGPWKFTNLNYIQYYSLPPGDYKFEVAAEDQDGKYRSEVHTLNFIIRPRFVDTALFKILLGFGMLILLATIISSIFSYQKLKATNVIKLLQAEFKALSYQINPHFIFNVLNSIQYYILKKDTNNAVHLLGSFSLLIRRIVNNSRQQYISIIEEIECLREYLDLEKMRLDNKFEYSINIDGSIRVEDKNILPMIIQPIVENSIWHGIVPSLKPGVISVQFKKENDAVVCTVEDNGVGINATLKKKEKNQNNLSMAMENVRERLKIIGELNDSSWEIKTSDKSVGDPAVTGTIVTIVFPVVKK